MAEIMFNGMVGFMDMPGLSGNQSAPYNPHADQGLGFHQDGTVRRADGTTGNNAGSSNYDGRRAAFYMQSGLTPHAGIMSGPYGTNYGQRLGYDDSRSGPRRDVNSEYTFPAFKDPQNYFMQRGLNYGLGLANSMGEAAFTGLSGKGKARLNFMIDTKGRVNGEGDVLYPFYDGQYTTVFGQAGARSMSGFDNNSSKDGRGADRWIGNFGLGQRWYPGSTVSEDGKNIDSGSLMLGYNVFFDNDFTRSHQRGGLGVEGQYDWLHLAANYYTPLSGWKGSYDFDSRFVEERPAEGWDVRAKGYLPFYRNLAVTWAYTQWYGDNVGMYSSSKLERDPKVWSYGLEYTPVPLVSGFINQRTTEQGRSDTEFGLNFTYHFQMPWEEQISHSKVAELRTVGQSRHEFVDRENRIILEYKAKNSYRIELVSAMGKNRFKFRILDGFDKFKAGQTVRVTAGGGVTLAEAPVAAQEKSLLAAVSGAFVDFFSVSTAHAADFSITKVTDSRGEFIVMVNSATTGDILLTVQAGEHSESFKVGVIANIGLTVSPATLPDATLSSPYTQALSTSGGMGPYTYTVSSGTLPTGLSLSGNTISGTPLVTGPFSFTVTVTDGNGVTADKNFSLTVAAAIPLSITTASPLTAATEGAAYSQALAATGGVAAYTWAVTGGALPAGLTLNSGTGALSGTPTATGPFNFTVTVTDGNGVTADKNFSLTVAPATYAISLAATSPPNETGSSTVTATVQRNGVPVSGENVAFTWVVKGSSQSAQPGTTTSTTPSGEATYTLNGSGDRRTLTVTATSNGQSATADVTFGVALSSPYIALMPGTGTANWSDAQAYCQSQGGSLPSGAMPVNPITDSSLPAQTVYWGHTNITGLTHSTWNSKTVSVVVDNHPYWIIRDGDTVIITAPLLSDTRVVCVP